MSQKLMITTLLILLLNGCTTLITAPIEIAGAVAGAAIDVGSAGVHAVTGSNDDKKED